MRAVNAESPELVDLRRKTLGKFFKDRRTKAGLTQSDVAVALGYSTAQFISNWERGQSQPPMNVLPQLCKLLAIGHSDLVRAIMTYEERRLKISKKQLDDLLRRGRA